MATSHDAQNITTPYYDSKTIRDYRASFVMTHISRHGAFFIMTHFGHNDGGAYYMSDLVQSRNGEESFNKFWNPDPDQGPVHLRLRVEKDRAMGKLLRRVHCLSTPPRERG